MPRPVKFETDALLDGALAAVSRHGTAATVAQIAIACGAPTGSLYHRFGSREQLLVTLWARSIEHFHQGLFAAAERDDADQALANSAVHVARFCRDHPDVAVAMTLYRQPDAVAAAVGELRDRVAQINGGVEALFNRLTVRRYGRTSQWRREVVMTAVQQLPYGLVRPYVGLAPVPTWLDEVILAASRATLQLGETKRPR